MSDRTPEEILTYCNAATPGPWHTDNGNIFSGESLLLDHMQEFPTKDGLWRAGEQAMADCTFIANARTDLPKLAEAHRRLRVAAIQARGALRLESSCSRMDGEEPLGTTLVALEQLDSVLDVVLDDAENGGEDENA